MKVKWKFEDVLVANQGSVSNSTLTDISDHVILCYRMLISDLQQLHGGNTHMPPIKNKISKHRQMTLGGKKHLHLVTNGLRKM